MGVETNQTQSYSPQNVREDRLSKDYFKQGYEAGLNDASLRASGGIVTPTVGGQLRAISQEERIAELFKYHAPREDQLPKYDAIRTAAKHFAEILLKNTTYGADQSDALRKLRECVMVANASVALDGLS